ncbi:MAG: HAD family hydrolase [Rhodanobacteraceae bacterium]
MRARALGFDFDHTLGLDNKLERVAFMRLLEPIVADGGAVLGTLHEEILRIDALLARQRSGACSIEEAVDGFVRERGVADASGYADEYKRFALAGVDAFVVPLPGARECCARMRDLKIPHGILTNGWSPLQQRKAARVGFEGPVIASADIGSQKPAAGAFAALVTALGTDAADVAYVGDNPAIDVAGALGAGLRAVWLDAEGDAYPANVARPTAVIHSLHEVLAFVRP